MGMSGLRAGLLCFANLPLLNGGCGSFLRLFERERSERRSCGSPLLDRECNTVSTAVWSKMKALQPAALPPEIYEDVVVVLERRDPCEPLYSLFLKFSLVVKFQGWRIVA